jgi:small conductance mechanosensitive channel
MPTRSPDTESPRERARARMFETRSQSWREAGLLRQIDPHAVRRARVTALLLLPIFVGIVVLDHHLKGVIGKPAEWQKIEVAIRALSVIVLVALGWVIARDTGRALGPALFRRMEPATAGTVGFLIRLVTIAVAFLVALNVAGVTSQTLALGGALAAVVIGLAAQQTFGNLIAGTVLLSARPFRVGDRVRLQGGALAGQVDGVVSSLGLLYTTFVAAGESILVPNSVVLSVMVITNEQSTGLAAWSGITSESPPLGATTAPAPPTSSEQAVGATSPPPPRPPRPPQ